MTKFIFFDIDGTLIEFGKPISDRTREAIQKAQQNGHRIFLSTGRTLHDVPDSLKGIDFDGIVSSAGAMAVYKGETILNQPISDEKIRTIRNVLDDLGIAYILETNSGSFSTMRWEDVFSFHGQDGASSELDRMNRQWPKLKPIEEYENQAIYKIVFHVDQKEKIVRLYDKLEGLVKILVFENRNDAIPITAGEISDPVSDKGKAILQLCESLNHPVCDTIAFGDSQNDLEMIQAAALGIAMQNAENILKDHADRICPSVSEDGVAQELEKLRLI